MQSVYSGINNVACLQGSISNADLDIMWKNFSCTSQELETEVSETIGKIATMITTTSITGRLQSRTGFEIFYWN